MIFIHFTSSNLVSICLHYFSSVGNDSEIFTFSAINTEKTEFIIIIFELDFRRESTPEMGELYDNRQRIMGLQKEC